MQRCAYPLLLVAVIGGLLPAIAAATPADAADRELQALKAEAVEIGRELQAVERELNYPGATRVSLHVAVRVSGFLLDSVSVSIDGGAPIEHDYSDSQALSLLKDNGWHRLARLRLDPGSHRLQARFSGHFHDARAGEAPITGQVEATFEKGAEALDLVLPIARSAHEPGGDDLAALRKLRPARTAVLLPLESPGPAAAGTPDDPRMRAALFLKNDHRHFSALVELAGLRHEAGDALPPSFWLLLAECHLAFGMDEQAAAIHQRLAGSAPDGATLARAQLQLAQFDYQNGRHAEAVERLRAARERLPGALRNDWRVLMTNALLAQQRYADVVALVRDEGLGSATAVLRYNLAVALIRSGDVAGGRERLDDVGTMAVTSLEQLVLRDKANLTLGYQYLQEQRGRAAREVFGRVRTQGPFSNRALLGLGWAEIAQEPAVPAAATAPVPAAAAVEDSLGTLLRTGQPAGGRLDIEGPAAAPSTLPAAEQDALRRALVAWVELIRRDPMDPAVQEGLLAIPWALDRLQAHEQSLTRYLNAIAALEAARGRMNEAIRSVRGSVLVNSFLQHDPDSERGWLWKVRALPGVPETFFLQSLLAEHAFQETLKRLRDARMLGARLEAWRKQLAGLAAAGDGARLQPLRARIDALRPRFGLLAAAQDDALEAVSIRELEGQRATIERYLTEARFAVARIYDRQAAQGAP